MALTKERKLEIAYTVLKNRIRRGTSFRDLDSTKRDIGNSLKEKEFVAINLTAEEAREFVDSILREVFEQQMSQLK